MEIKIFSQKMSAVIHYESAYMVIAGSFFHFLKFSSDRWLLQLRVWPCISWTREIIDVYSIYIHYYFYDLSPLIIFTVIGVVS